MKRENENISFDSRAVKDALPNMPLPKSLSAESVTDLVTGVPQKKSKRPFVKKAVAGVLAASVVLCGLFVLDEAVYAPSIKPEKNNVAYVNDYSKILSLMKDYRKSENFRNKFQSSAVNDPASIPETSLDKSDGSTNGNAFKDMDYSETNTRVDGIDEADIVKTDGKNLYVASGKKVFIIKLLDGGKCEKLALLTPLDGIEDKAEETSAGDYTDGFTGMKCYSTDYSIDGVSGIYVTGTRLTVEFSCIKGGEQRTGAAFYDISDPSAPVLKKIFLQDGRTISSRQVGSSLILVSQKTVYDNTDIDDGVIPEVSVGTNGESLESEKVASNDIAIASTETPDRFLVITKINTDTFDGTPETAAVLGSGNDVYCTDETLYVATDCYDSKNDKNFTKILSYDITGDKPSFKASGSVEGYILDTFSTDEYNGFFRIAAQKSDGACVYVLDKSLNEVGRVDKIAPDEEITAVRFSGNTGYVVTFLNTDPLFVIDLSDPKNPTVKGELKIPGFSSYLHPVGENLMLGVGTGGNEDGADGSAKLSLFDVSNPAEPKEIDTFILKNASFNTEYKAFVADSKTGTFFVPYSRWSEDRDANGDVIAHTWTLYTGIVRIAVENGKLVKKNVYDTLLTYDDGQYTSEFTRAAFAGSTVYGIDCYGTNGISVVSFDMETGGELAKSTFENN